MSSEDFTPLLIRKLSEVDSATGPSSCQWDERTRVLALTYRSNARPRHVYLFVPRDAAMQFSGGTMDQDVVDVWGEGIDSVEGAARFATVHLAELVQTTSESPLRLELTATGIRRRV